MTKQKSGWVRGVQTVSTFPPESLFTQDAQTIARVMARQKVSPKGLGSAIRMVQFFINRAGKGLSPARRKTLERAKRILQAKHRDQAKRRAARTRPRR
jgi:tRNA(adenine34) deaminase